MSKSLGIICYIDDNEEPNAICFVGDLAIEPMEQAKRYLHNDNIPYTSIVFAMWQNALDDEYGNRYEPKIMNV